MGEYKMMQLYTLVYKPLNLGLNIKNGSSRLLERQPIY